MMMVKKLSMSLVLALTCASALAKPVAWREDFGQGNLDYSIDKAGYSLDVGCPTSDGMADALPSVFLLKTSTDRQVTKFTIRANGNTYDGPLDVRSRLDQRIFLSLLDSLRRSDAVVTFGNKTIVYPKSNAAAVLPVYGKKFPCNLM